jgi:hypothetical protein
MRRLRGLCALAVLSAAACGRGSSSGVQACPHDLDMERNLNLEIVVTTAPARIHRELDLAGLSKLPGTETLGPGGKLQGLTVVTHQLSYKTGIALTHPLFGGPACAWIDHLTLDLTPSEIAIYVPSEYPQDSCEYEQILTHERLHEETHRETLAELTDDMRRALHRADWLPERGTPLAVADRPEAERRIESMIDKVTKPVYAEFKETLARRQAVIDLPENYQWTAMRCKNWK